MSKGWHKDVFVTEKQAKGFRDFKPNGTDKGKNFSRTSKGAFARGARLYKVNKSGQQVKIR